jgi:hypothetical protein
MPAITSQTEGNYADEFIKSLVEGDISFEKVTLITGQNLKAGTVLGKITASGKYTILAPAAADGSQNAAAILRSDCDATSADKPCAVLSRLAEVTDSLLVYPAGITGPQKTTAQGQLAALNIICR